MGLGEATEKKKDQASRERAAKAMCVRYTLLIANSLLALLGLLLLAGGVWRIVDDQSLRDVANELRDTAEPRRRISASSPSTPSASSSSSCSRLLPSSSSMSTTQTSISSRTPSARRLRRLTLTLRS